MLMASWLLLSIAERHSSVSSFCISTLVKHKITVRCVLSSTELIMSDLNVLYSCSDQWKQKDLEHENKKYS